MPVDVQSLSPDSPTDVLKAIDEYDDCRFRIWNPEAHERGQRTDADDAMAADLKAFLAKAAQHYSVAVDPYDTTTRLRLRAQWERGAAFILDKDAPGDPHLNPLRRLYASLQRVRIDASRLLDRLSQCLETPDVYDWERAFHVNFGLKVATNLLPTLGPHLMYAFPSPGHVETRLRRYLDRLTKALDVPMEGYFCASMGDAVLVPSMYIQIERRNIEKARAAIAGPEADVIGLLRTAALMPQTDAAKPAKCMGDAKLRRNRREDEKRAWNYVNKLGSSDAEKANRARIKAMADVVGCKVGKYVSELKAWEHIQNIRATRINLPSIEQHDSSTDSLADLIRAQQKDASRHRIRQRA